MDTAVTMNQNGDHGIPVPDYVEENVSAKVVKIIQSYTGVVVKWCEEILTFFCQKYVFSCVPMPVFI